MQLPVIMAENRDRAVVGAFWKEWTLLVGPLEVAFR